MEQSQARRQAVAADVGGGGRASRARTRDGAGSEPGATLAVSSSRRWSSAARPERDAGKAVGGSGASILRFPLRGRGEVEVDPEAGMTTAEYAVGTVAACGFAGVLVKLLSSSRVSGMLSDIVERALSVAS